MVVLLDRSDSMARDLAGQPCAAGAGCASKWDQAGRAIADLVARTADSVDWGLMFVGSVHANDATCQEDATPDVAPGVGTAAAIVAAIAGTGPGGSRPTTAAVNNLATYLMVFSPTRQNRSCC